MAEIVGELTEYVTDVDVDVARRAIQTIGHIAWRLPNSATRVIQEMLKLLEVDIEYVTAETVIAMKDLMRKYPDVLVEEVMEVIPACLATIEEPEARVAVLWMLGEVGHELEEGPYILEPLIDNWEELTHAVRLELMSCTMKMFFRRPPECQKMLGKLLKQALEDPSNVDVHDRAMLYYRLLEYDIEDAQRVVLGQKETITNFVEDTETELKDQIFEEFNSLSVIYQKPAAKFVSAKHLGDAAGGASYESEGESSAEDEEDDHLEDSEKSDDDDDDDDKSDDGSSSSSDSGSDDEDYESLVFLAVHSFGKQVPQVFEKNWMSSQQSENVALTLKKSSTNESAIDQRLSQAGLNSMATGASGGTIRAYYIGERQDKPGIFMGELIINLGARTINATLKSSDASALPSFKSYFTKALAGL